MSTISASSNKGISKLISIRNDYASHSNELNKSDFIVGDKVYIASNPDRIGTAVFNGTTKFSDGIWIGVALEKPFGKNNGVVQGIQYFQCEENHGIFVRPTNLRHASEKNSVTTNRIEICSESVEYQINNSNLPVESEVFNFMNLNSLSNVATKINLGERVYIASKSNSGRNKSGILRFLGPTKFADGSWAGIELDNPIGKNDGSVNGLRYFSCKPQYGLFILEDKVKRLDLSTMKPLTRIDSGAKNGSNESISSVASNFSSASRTRARMGMNTADSAKKLKSDKMTEKNADKLKFFRTNSKDIKDGDKTSFAMQNVLKEKEQHVEQLIREREIERVDLATATARLKELEKNHSRHVSSLHDQKLVYDKTMNELQNTIYMISQERDHLMERLDEEKKKVEDLMFRIEEKDIDEADLEHKTEENESQIFELNENLALERDLREQLEKRLKDLPTVDDNNSIDSKYIAQIKSLEGKVLKLKLDLNNEKNDAKVKTLSKLLEEKDAVANDLQDRFEKAKCRLSESKKELEAEKNLQIANQEENKLLKNEINNLKYSIANLAKDKSRSSSITENNQKSMHNSQTEENSRINGQAKESLDLQYSLDIVKAENTNISATLIALQEEMERIHLENEEKRLEFNDMLQKCKRLEQEKLDYIKSKRSVVEENEKLVVQLSSDHKQLEKVRTQVSDLLNDNKRLLEFKSEAEINEKNSKLEIENLKGQINFLEVENAAHMNSLHELENDSSQNSCILQMSIKIEALESSIQELNVVLKSEKEQNMGLITKNATLHSELEHLRQRRDDEDNLMYDQLQSLQSINKLLESDKFSLSESMEAKNKELIVIRDRLLKVSQEHETLLENFNESTQKLEREKRLLNDKFRKMERQMDESERKSQFSLSDSTADKRKQDGKDQITLLKDAKENAEQQIGFLNNVIVKSESKCNTLQLENETLKEKIKDLESGNTFLSTKTKKVVPPRLYCDVCEIFDSHDTDKCPIIDTQSTSSSPPTNVIQTSLKNKHQRAPRLYCDICEIFDAHDTHDCQDQQTF